jgi:hypothetical protein
LVQCISCEASLDERQGDRMADGVRCSGCSMRAQIATHEQAPVERGVKLEPVELPGRDAAARLAATAPRRR